MDGPLVGGCAIKATLPPPLRAPPPPTPCVQRGPQLSVKATLLRSAASRLSSVQQSVGGDVGALGGGSDQHLRGDGGGCVNKWEVGERVGCNPS